MKLGWGRIGRLWAVSLLLLWQAGTAVAWAQPGGFSTAPSQAFKIIAEPSQEARADEVTARLLAWAPQGIGAGRPLWLGLHLRHAPGWHTYWKNPGQAGAATSVQWQLPQGWMAGEVDWPVPVKIPVEALINYGYDGDVLLAAPVQVQATADAATVSVGLQANWLACKIECVPQQGEMRLQLPVGPPVAGDAAVFAANRVRVPANLSNGQLSATVQTDGTEVVFKATGLPAAWRDRPLNVYPETPGVFAPGKTIWQRWEGPILHIKMPLDAWRTQNPETLTLAVALQDAASARQPVIRNASGKTAYRLAARAQGQWPAIAASADISPGSAQEEPVAGAATMEQMQPVAAGPAISWWLVIAGALSGGFLMNLMPCVFPVLGIKVLGLARHAHNPRELRFSGMLYSAGCITSFLLLAAGLLALRAGGEQLGWGFQLQNPYVVAALAALFVVLAFNLLGMFHAGQWLPAAWQALPGRHGLATEAFLAGVLAVLVSSPCSAPFVGAALGLALGLPAVQALAIFACLGLGLAFPVLAASFHPKTLAWLPRPGPWMQTLRQWMALPMFATAAWLIWILKQQSGSMGAAVLLGLLFLLAGLIGVWRLRGGTRRLGVAFFSLALLGLGVTYGRQLAEPASQETLTKGIWQPWSPQRVQAALQAGHPVLVDYTAAWCVTCQFNKKTVLEQQAFLDLAHEYRLVLLRADWSRSDPAITASLRSLGRSAVPTYAVYHPGAIVREPLIVTELLTLEKMRRALENTQ